MLLRRDWESRLQLAVCEIRDYGASFVRVCRRLHALLHGLLDSLSPQQLPSERAELRLLHELAEPARKYRDLMDVVGLQCGRLTGLAL
ncbi:hypothetical protein [Streptomyces sp. NBC_01373]|uniref:hypothetical protein n=1 Tax=Streptomyces sp. NBC_01373 TaxID=2903843 RepID=UPI0022578C33|nr:hypothetical protein [Streptomyces sp. NBC_01373]MCX4706330.1 hypothetical protein [Streptomyces sp. NBC_01373]